MRPGDVGHDELGRVAGARRARSPTRTTPRFGHQRREGVVGDLGPRRRDPRDQGGLADVGKTDERHVGLKLQLEVEPALLADLALLGEGRRASLVGEKPGVALAPESPFGREPAVSGAVQVDQDLAVHRCRPWCRPGTMTTGVFARASRAGASRCRAGRRSPAERGGRESRAATPDCGRRRARRRRPRPPSPPSGPPLATWASRRKLTHPAPPLPALACNCALSTKADIPSSYGSSSLRS